jgi:hypothetical protein
MRRGLSLGLVGLGLAAAVWVTAVIVSWASLCPSAPGNAGGSWPTGLDKAAVGWPPGADCGQSTYEALPWAPAVITALVVVGLAAIAAGAIVAAVRLRGSRLDPPPTSRFSS